MMETQSKELTDTPVYIQSIYEVLTMLLCQQMVRRLELHLSLMTPCLKWWRLISNLSPSTEVKVSSYSSRIFCGRRQSSRAWPRWVNCNSFVLIIRCQFTFSSLMNQVRLAGGWDCQEVHRASRVSPIWYFSFIPVILGFSSGRSEENKIRSK